MIRQNKWNNIRLLNCLLVCHRYTMVESIDGGWGSVNDEGTWTGMIGMILRNEIDIAISDFCVTEARSRVVTFSKNIIEERCVFDFDY